MAAKLPEERWLERYIYDMEWKKVRVGDLEELPGPYDYMEKEPGVTIEFTPVRWEFGRTFFVPPWRPAPIWYPTLRVWVKREDKPGRVPWWDITSTRLFTQLFEILKRPDITKSRIRITPEYKRPRTIFSVEVIPPE